MRSVSSDLRSLSEKVTDRAEKMSTRVPPASKSTAHVRTKKQGVNLSKVKKEMRARAIKGAEGSKVLLTVYFPAGSSEIDPVVARMVEGVASESLKENLKLSIVVFVSSPTPPPHEQHTWFQAQTAGACLISSLLFSVNLPLQTVISPLS